MDFRILGPLEVIEDGRALDIGGQKQRALLAVLLLHANEPVSTGLLIEALWEDGPPETAQKALQVYVSQLRKIVGRERLETRPPGYLLRVAPADLDLIRFETLRKEGRYGEALAEWRGPALADFSFERFAQGEASRLESERLACVEERIERDLAAGRHAELVGELEGLVRGAPLRETLRGQLMLALYRSGRQAEALTVYQEGRDALVEELGIEPGPELRRLHQAILRQDPALEPAAGGTAPTGTVTFLFSDVVGSTALLRELGQARYADALEVYRRLFRESCRRLAGYEIDTQGDAFFFAFARAKDAASAAADCQRALAAHSWPDGAVLRARIGLHTGEATLTNGRYVGLAVHRAARICSLGRGGQVLCSSATASVLEDEELDELSLRRLGDYRLKDFDQPVALYQVDAPGLDSDLPAPERNLAGPADEPPRGILVGREAELAELEAALGRALEGSGGLFLLVGEPGIGKSRLAEELARRARSRGALVLVGRCWEAGGAPPYWPWVQSIRSYVRGAEPAALRAELGAGAADLAQLLPELRELFPDIGDPPTAEPETARFRLFEAATGLLTSASRARPIVLVLDDLHAADEPSLLLLQFLARELSTSRLLVVGAYRDVDPMPTKSLTSTLLEVARESSTRILPVGGLAAADVASFVELVSGETPREELVAALREETEGNPLFVGEIVRLLAAEGSFDAAELAVPQSVRDVIARRLRHLSDECVRVLTLASVLGREFTLAGLARMAEVSEDALLDTLDEAMEARVVADVQGNPGRLRFAHVLIRDTLYEGLTAVRRVRLHRLVLEVFEAEGSAEVAALAYHAVAGSDFGKGLDYARRAGDDALALLAYEEAARLYAMAIEALELVSPGDDAARCELLLSLGEAEIRAGQTPEAKRTFLAAADLARRGGLGRELALAAAGYAGRIVWARAGDDRLLVPLLEEGLAALGEEDVVLRARLLARLAGALRDEHTRDRRDRLSREAVELARSANDRAALAYALDGRGYAILAPDKIEEVGLIGTELCAVAASVGDRERVVAGYMLRVIAQLVAGDMEGAHRDHDEARRVAGELRQPAQLWQASGDQALIDLAVGRIADAERHAARAYELGERALPIAAIPVWTLHRFALADLCGGLEEVEPALRSVAAEYPARPVLRCALAYLYTRIGRDADARAVFDELTADSCAAVPFDQEWPLALTLLSETCVLLGDREAAAVLHRLLAPWSHLVAVDVAEGFRGSVSRPLGLLAALLGRSDEAVRHLEDALATNERMGARPWIAVTQRDLASVLRSRGEAGRAEELEAAARSLADELGLEPTSRT
jgi:DNA-binding SARP family transcriptional activator